MSLPGGPFAFLNTLAVLCFASQRSFLQKTNEQKAEEDNVLMEVDNCIFPFIIVTKSCLIVTITLCLYYTIIFILSAWLN